MTTIKLPDFDDMAKLIEEISDTNLRRMMLDIEIKSKEAEIVRLSSTEDKYFVNGKPPSVAYLEATLKFTGMDSELISKRQALAELTSKLDQYRLLYDLMKSKIDVWRSQTANERVATQS
jgi:hypothetical protein